MNLPYYSTYISTYMCVSKYHNLMQSVNFLHNNLLGCNYCDTSSPHNAMHSHSKTAGLILTDTDSVSAPSWDHFWDQYSPSAIIFIETD